MFSIRDYMVVREIERLNSKRRSFSNSSDSSVRSASSSKYLHYCANQRIPSYRSRATREYQIGHLNTPVYQIEKKRAQIFGIEELRYRPAYFDQITLSKEKQQKKQDCQKIFRSSALRSQRSAKQLKYIAPTPSTVGQRSKQAEIDQNKMTEKPKAKRESVLEEMVELNINNNLGRLNEFYASAMDLKSRGELFKSSKQNSNAYFPSQRSRKNSIFDQASPKVRGLDLSSCDQIELNSQSSESSRRFSNCLAKVKPKPEQVEEFPPTVTVRRKVYFRYEKNRH